MQTDRLDLKRSFLMFKMWFHVYFQDKNMILWFSIPTQKFVKSPKTFVRKQFFIADSERSDQGLSIPLLFSIFWTLYQKLPLFEQIVHSKKTFLWMVLTYSWNIESHFWDRIWTDDIESFSKIHSFACYTILGKKLQVFEKITDTFLKVCAFEFLPERYIYIYLW